MVAKWEGAYLWPPSIPFPAPHMSHSQPDRWIVHNGCEDPAGDLPARFEQLCSKIAPAKRFLDISGCYALTIAPAKRFLDISGRYALTIAPAKRFLDISGCYALTIAPAKRFLAMPWFAWLPLVIFWQQTGCA